MPQEKLPIHVKDSKGEGWIVYEEDNAYKLVENLSPDEDGIRHVDASLIAKVRGWWYDEAVGRIEDVIEGLEIPWSDLEITEREALEMEAADISAKMIEVSRYQVKVSRMLGRVDVKLRLAKSALDHAVNKMLSRNEAKGSVAVRTAAIISSDKRLRNAKIEAMEGEALKCSLDAVRSALGENWSSLSRLLSARMHEPVE